MFSIVYLDVKMDDSKCSSTYCEKLEEKRIMRMIYWRLQKQVPSNPKLGISPNYCLGTLDLLNCGMISWICTLLPFFPEVSKFKLCLHQNCLDSQYQYRNLSFFI